MEPIPSFKVNFSLSISPLRNGHGIPFKNYFDNLLCQLNELKNETVSIRYVLRFLLDS